MDLFNGLSAKMDYDHNAFEVRYRDVKVEMSLTEAGVMKMALSFPAFRAYQRPSVSKK